MSIGREKRSRIIPSPEETKRRMEIIQRERDRIKGEIEQKFKDKKKNMKDFLDRRKKNPEATLIQNQTVYPIPIPIKAESQYPEDISGFISKKSSDRVFIIAGGESINEIDLSLLYHEDTIVVNRSIFSVPNPTFFISMDNTFYGKISQTERNELIFSKAHKVFVANFGSGVLEEKNGIIRDVKNKMDYELSFYDSILKVSSTNKRFGNSLNDFFHGNNSGFCAIQLAIILGYKEIYLLGIDLISTKSTHFHGGYGEHVGLFNLKLKKYQDDFFIPALEEYNLRVSEKSKIISCSKHSKLNGIIGYNFFDDLDFKPREMNNLQNLVVVGYYTINTPYQTEAQKTINSCINLGLNHDFLGIENLGNWQANTRYKAKFMLDMLDKHVGKKLLYVDCDAIIRSRPVLFENYNCDVAVRYQDFRWRKNECLSGTIYMENNDKTRKLCNLWMNSNIKEGDQTTNFEQWNLGLAIQEMIKTEGLNFRNLPPEYTYIFDTFKQLYPGIRPVIEHFQASRSLKDKVDNGKK